MKITICHFTATMFLILQFTCISCNKLIEVPPPATSITSDNVFSNDATAIAALTSIYSKISTAGLLTPGSFQSISLTTGLYSDELTLLDGTANTNARLARFYSNKLTNQQRETHWETIYNYLQTANIVIEKVPTSSLSNRIKLQLEGEAKFIRAFLNFYLVNFYGDIPLIMISNYATTSSQKRSNKNDVLKEIIIDLESAKDLLTEEYLGNNSLTSTLERTRPNKNAAIALLARTYLFVGDWTKAENMATSIIDKKNIYDTVPLSQVFLKNNKEAIWQLQPVNTGWNTEVAISFVLNTPPSSAKPVYLSQSLLTSFESNDNRRKMWISDTIFNAKKYSFPFKYKIATAGQPVVEYNTILRLAELYLIRAESRLHLSNPNGALEDVNLIRKRANLSLLNSSDLPSLDAKILNERRVELFCEWGHRWLDIKRKNMADSIMHNEAILKGSTWKAEFKLFPIPLADIIANNNIDQNPGY